MEKHPAEKLADELHNVAHAKDPKKSHVVMVWNDGEITYQKNCDLLWERNLHQMEPPLVRYVAGLKFPYVYRGNSFAFVDSKEEAMRIRALLIVP